MRQTTFAATRWVGLLARALVLMVWFSLGVGCGDDDDDDDDDDYGADGDADADGDGDADADGDGDADADGDGDADADGDGDADGGTTDPQHCGAPGWSDDPTCLGCLDESCCDQAAACAADEQCTAFLQCVADGMSWDTCYENSLPASNALGHPLVMCLNEAGCLGLDDSQLCQPAPLWGCPPICP